jgi:SAM-dependent methyltransferase
MANPRHPGTGGYAENAETLVDQYETLSFEFVHRDAFGLFPASPGLVLDIGSGTGRDAAGFAALGHRVVAAEPTAELRSAAERLHPSDHITWVDDALPDLPVVTVRGEYHDLIMLCAVWMHLDEDERRAAMPIVADRIAPDGVLVIYQRHGPVPDGRRMFEVTADETIALAEGQGLKTILRMEDKPSQLGQAGVYWMQVVFRR